MADQQIIAFDRNFSLLSFGEEAEEDESTVASVSKVGLLNTVLKYFFMNFVAINMIYIYESFLLLPMKIMSSQLAAIAFRFFDVIVSFLITALLIIIMFCSFDCYTYINLTRL